MKIAIVGTGYVGLVTGTCFAEMGNTVYCVDIDKTKIKNLNNGIIPIYEPGLEELVKKNFASNRLQFTTNLAECIDYVDIVFSAVGTPPDEDGSADLKYVLDVARTFGKCINKYTIIVTKSTVPVGTAVKVKNAIVEELLKRGANVSFDVVSNPEFLKEGTAVDDFMNPERIVVGVDSERAKNKMAELYKPFNIISDKLIFTDIPSAEMIKYAANSMLATRISFMNDIANLCEKVGADVDSVRKGIGADSRIGKKFLYAGCGYGGSCFPKDVKALIKTADQNGYSMGVLKAVEDVNERQKSIVYQKLTKFISDTDLSNCTIGIWGLAFKPNTDDMREAPSLVIIDKLLKAGAKVQVYDPIAMNECKRRIGDSVTYCNDIYGAALGAHAILLLTEWKEFRMPSWDVILTIMSANSKVLIDGRNIYNRKEMEEIGFKYDAIGK